MAIRGGCVEVKDKGNGESCVRPDTEEAKKDFHRLAGKDVQQVRMIKDRDGN